MPTVKVTIRTNDPEIPPHEVEGFAPTHLPDSLLIVTRPHVFADGKWAERDGWCITHRPSGMHLGKVTWPTRAAALDVLDKCDQTFPAWPAAIGKVDDPATIACAYKFKVALGKLAA